VSKVLAKRLPYLLASQNDSGNEKRFADGVMARQMKEKLKSLKAQRKG
jgi:hypothetical protein